MTKIYTSIQQVILRNQFTFIEVLHRVERIIFMRANSLHSLNLSGQQVAVISRDQNYPLPFEAVDGLKAFKPQLQEYRRLIDLGDVSLYQP